MESRNWSREAAGSRYEGMNQLPQAPESVSALTAGSANEWLTGTWKTNMTWWKHIWTVEAESKMFRNGCNNVKIYCCWKVSVQFLINFHAWWCLSDLKVGVQQLTKRPAGIRPHVVLLPPAGYCSVCCRITSFSGILIFNLTNFTFKIGVKSSLVFEEHLKNYFPNFVHERQRRVHFFTRTFFFFLSFLIVIANYSAQSHSQTIVFGLTE